MPTRKPLSEPASRGARSASAKSSSTGRETSGRKQGGKRGNPASAPLQKGGLTANPLYKALLKIGSNEKSIKHLGLRKYDVLLRSPEVRRRAGSTTDPDELARCASDLLRQFVGEITDPTRQLVAQAALCTEKIYEGRGVEQRKDMLLQSKAKITWDMFRYHREIAFGQLVDILDHTVSISVPPPSQSTIGSASTQRASSGAHSLARMAARLHYSILASIFVARFTDNLKDIEPYVSERYGALDIYAKCAFEDFYVFLINSEYIIMGEEYMPHEFSSDQLRDLQFLFRTIEGCGPLDWTHTERLRDALWDHADVVRAIFTETWEPWFYDLSPVPTQSKIFPPELEGSPSISRLEPVTAKAGAIVQLINKAIDLQEPVLSEARTRAYKMLAYTYDFDEFVPILDGRSLRQHTDTYFDSASNTLAYSDIVWHDNNN